jgi:hypothetical protein
MIYSCRGRDGSRERLTSPAILSPVSALLFFLAGIERRIT